MLSLFFGDLNKLASVLALFLGPFHIRIAAIAGFGAPPRVYSNEEIQNIIQAITEAKPAAAKSSYKRLFKAHFLDIYKDYNHMAC